MTHQLELFNEFDIPYNVKILEAEGEMLEDFLFRTYLNNVVEYLNVALYYCVFLSLQILVHSLKHGLAVLRFT
jgi:hypothetical protein